MTAGGRPVGRLWILNRYISVPFACSIDPSTTLPWTCSFLPRNQLWFAITSSTCL
jgi:hypothetical protein